MRRGRKSRHGCPGRLRTRCRLRRRCPWWIWWARRLRARRWLNDVALALAAFLVALLTTLSREYFGTAFGTLQDYMAVLTWAFGLTASLTLLTSGLAPLQSTGLRPLLRR
jgi:hypothetical protein